MTIQIDGTVLDENHLSYARLTGVLKHLQSLGSQMTTQVEKVKTIMAGSPNEGAGGVLRTKQLALIAGRKLFRGDKTPLEVLDMRIEEMKGEIIKKPSQTAYYTAIIAKLEEGRILLTPKEETQTGEQVGDEGSVGAQTVSDEVEVENGKQGKQVGEDEIGNVTT